MINRMKLIIVLLLVLAYQSMFAQPTIYIVRHAEKIEDWQKGIAVFQPLNKKGLEKSERLAKFFDDIKLSAIYSSNTSRTLQTAYPTSKAKGVKIVIERACADTSAIDSFLQNLSENYKDDESILIVSHSNIIPYYLIKSGLTKDHYKEMDFTKENGWLLTDYYGEVFVINKNKIERKKF